MKRLLLLLFGLANAANGMQQPPRVDANGFEYTDENTVQDRRKIAILSYGSLVNQPADLQTGAKLEAFAFQPINIQLPVSLMRESSKNTLQRRITAVIDRDGEPKRVWAATSKFQFLPNARNNLAAREGIPYRNAKYDLTNIFYMKKLLPNRIPDTNEEVVPQADRWVIRKATNERQQLPMQVAQQVAQWADGNGYTAIIWASFAPNISNREEIIRRLASDDTLLKNTQDYIRDLPNGAQSAFERAIIAGKETLRAFVEGAEAISAVRSSEQARSLTAAAQIPQSIQKIIQEINLQDPNLFANTSSEMQQRLVEFLENPPQQGAKFNLLGINTPIPQTKAWLSLGNLFGFQIQYSIKSDPNYPRDVTKKIGYTFFINDEPELARSRSSSDISLEIYLSYLNSGSHENARIILNKLVNQYKIHLMPIPDINMGTNIIYLLGKAFENDPELKKNVLGFKISVTDHQRDDSGNVMPYVVFYIRDGKNSAQIVLNKLYKLFKEHPEIKGSGERPRYNAKVNDLIWVAQGDADNKIDAYAQYYEPSRYYYRPDITGRVENYHLKHPETGQELIN